MITVNTIDSTNFEVIVEGHKTTTHRVTLTHLYYQKLTNNQVSPEILVEKSFEFLLDRETNTSILSRFDLPIIERYFARYEFDVDYVLCGSDCESMAIEDLLAFEPDAVDRFHRQWLGYTESQGSPALRSEICNIYRAIKPEQVLVHTGAEEAIFLFMHAMLSAEDHVIVHWPGYQSLVEVARSIGCEVTLWKAAGVLLLPGTVYDDPGNHFRIGFGRKNMQEAVGRLEDFLQNHNFTTFTDTIRVSQYF
jgi:hypothetical protein